MRGSQRNLPVSLPPGKTRYPLYKRLDGPQKRSGRLRKTSPTQGFDPRTVQPVGSRYTDRAIAAHFLRLKTYFVSKFVAQCILLQGWPRHSPLPPATTLLPPCLRDMCPQVKKEEVKRFEKSGRSDRLITENVCKPSIHVYSVVPCT